MSSPLTWGFATLTTVATMFATLSCASTEPVPASGPLDARVARFEPDEPALIREARVVRTVDEVGDRRMAQATAATLLATSEAVREYAEQLVEDYRSLRERQAELGVSLGFTALKGGRAEHFEREIEQDVLSLIEHRGEGFDEAFLELMITEHEESLRLIETSLLPKAERPELRASIENDFRPLVRKSLARARELLSMMNE